jgi:hypothetical protein
MFFAKFCGQPLRAERVWKPMAAIRYNEAEIEQGPGGVAIATAKEGRGEPLGFQAGRLFALRLWQNL